MKKETTVKNLVGSLSVGIILAFLTLISGTNGGNVFGAQGAPLAPVQYTIHFSQTDISFGKLKGYDMVRLDGGGYISQLGKPMLPTREIRIALPQGMAAQTVRIVASELEEITGEYNVFPAQPPLRVGQTDDPVFIDPVSDIYGSSDPYPAQPVELTSQTDLAGQAIAVVQICPLKYIPAEKKLYLYTSLSLVVEGTDGYICGDYLSQNISEKGRRIYERTVKEMVVNQEAVTLTSSPLMMAKEALLLGGPFEHVIITSESNASYYQPLVDWHIKKGVRDTVVTTSYIYANFSGSDNQQKIRNFVIEARSDWNTLYFLIGGENGAVPFEYRSYEGDNIPSDQYYGDYDDDWTYEVFVGRVTAEGSTQINCFIDKVLKYETDPPLDDYSLDACLLGMDLTLASEPPYYTLTRSEDLKKSINSSYIPDQFNITTVYDTEPTNHRTKFLSALNDGQNLVNHSDHSDHSSMGTGDRNHGWYIYNSDVNNLTNTGRMSNIFSLGCEAMQLDYSDCIAEHFVIYNDLQAGVSFTGNTRSGWFYVGDPISLSGYLDLYWWRGLFLYNQYRLGEALAWTKDNCPSSQTIWKYCQWTLNLLGEPEMPLWTDSIKTMVVTHPDNFPTTPSSFPVHVEDAGGRPVDSTYVCLWKGDEVYERGYTDHNGDLSLEVNPSTQGAMYVTTTAQNFLPYQGSSECTGNLPPVAEFTFDPLDPTRHDTVQFSSTSYDDDGTIVSWQWDFGDDSTASGEQVTHLYESYASYTVTLIVEDDGGMSDTAQTEVAVEPICGDADDNGAGPNVADEAYLIAFIFDGGPPPHSMEAANIDGEGGINVADVTYLVNYLFFDGPEPVCGPIQ
jgi:hypothetical protein